MRTMLPLTLHNAIAELGPYLTGSFGDPTRIDYGTGHELSFIAWMLSLAKIGFVSATDASNLVLTVFRTYLDVLRRVQSVVAPESVSIFREAC